MVKNKKINKKKKGGQRRIDSMSGHGGEPESPLVIGTWKRWRRQRDLSAASYITTQFKLDHSCCVVLFLHFPDISLSSLRSGIYFCCLLSSHKSSAHVKQALFISLWNASLIRALCWSRGEDHLLLQHRWFISCHLLTVILLRKATVYWLLFYFWFCSVFFPFVLHPVLTYLQKNPKE